MNADELRPRNYDYARSLTRDMSAIERLAMAAVIGINGIVLWQVFPGIYGIGLGAVFGLVVAAIVVGEAWRQFQIQVLGYSAGPVEEADDA